jgi:hypothetical protein
MHNGRDVSVSGVAAHGRAPRLLMFAVPLSQGVPSLDQLLDRVAQYVTRFQDDFAIVLSDEQYDQTVVVKEESGRTRSRVQRQIRSETVFAWLLEQQSWLTAREVEQNGVVFQG